MSSASKHTPGPWRAFFGTENNSVLIGIGEESGEGIADCGQRFWKGKFGIWRGKDPSANANAHLIAAAPELYAALEFYENPDNWRLNGPLDPNSDNFIGQLHARAALAKARGETP